MESTKVNEDRRGDIPARLIYGIFVVSGVSALLYQVVWQRELLNIYGTNSESVTVVVAAFMLGLGIGSLVGGVLSKKPGRPLLVWFAAMEIGIGIYGALSLELFSMVGAGTAGSGTLETGLLAFALVLLPTLLMGATLPLLVAHEVVNRGSVGRSVGVLYFVNTLGASIGAFAAVAFVLGLFGLSGSILFAVALNFVTGGVVLVAFLRGRAARGGGA